MALIMFRTLVILIVVITLVSALGTNDGGPNSPVFNLDGTAFEKNIAAIFNKVAHSSATTKRSVPAFEPQVSASTTLSTVPSPLSTTWTQPSVKSPASRATPSPVFREQPSYAPPSKSFFTPPLPPELSNPFADKPTLRGTHYDPHVVLRRPVPPPSGTPAQERIPIRPKDLVQGPSQPPERSIVKSSKTHNLSKEQKSYEASEPEKRNISNEFAPTLHYPSISRILSGSNGRKQDIPEILLKPLPTKSPVQNIAPISTTERTTTTSTIRTTTMSNSVTNPIIFNLPNTRRQDDDEDEDDVDRDQKNYNENVFKTENIETVDGERLLYPQPQPPNPSKEGPIDDDRVIPHRDPFPLDPSWRIAWSLHVYIAAISFTLMALYSIYKIVRFNDATNLFTQSYFLTVHLLLTTVCTLRCFHLFYDANNLSGTLHSSLSGVLMYLPSPMLSTAFATLVLYLTRCSEAPSFNNKYFSPTSVASYAIVHVVLCISLQISSPLLGYHDEAKILPLICQCIYIIVCMVLGLCYMYVYRVIRSQIHITTNKSINNHVAADPMAMALNTAITTSIATALLFILMGSVQLFDCIFGVQERSTLYHHSWLWWGWQSSVRLLELTMCGLMAWVSSLSQYPLREKQLQQHSAHSGFALFPCGSSTSTENMDDVLYPAICSTNQAIQNYTMRTGKQVYDDSYPLNTLPEHLNITGTFERHSIRKSGTMGHFPHEGRGSISRHGNGVQTMRNLDTRGRHTPTQAGLQHEQASATGSTMLVAEDGFVRFRSLGGEEEEMSDSQSIIGTHGRGSSLAGSVRYNARHPNTVPHSHSHQHQHAIQHAHQHHHSMQHSHPNQGQYQAHHPMHHQVYNNT
ncbi:uncharacterized protein LOC127282972 [Leptopilina boulardi]|uniref:uncharacterized protein LOC127282972 n=1 Tax=Leptopilina boulardi TaxID=63433 RepID=UPI0021F64C5F|nr:uncharacterized protein LOC127282972 [Leptopilina boulardi]XP_051163543.1 uncharacterized protein LOC127282972 [Leptopilina boulardi]XP_051163544.1 uncharacterized protein LOC127282972 [Leptopilina boulardi]